MATTAAERRVIDAARAAVTAHVMCVHVLAERERVQANPDARARTIAAADHLRAQGDVEYSIVALIDAVSALDGEAAQ